ncbi:MAG: sulfatase [Proteobacteria bacterium]|nr:sulfatase [Pseudomonadota bacterium]
MTIAVAVDLGVGCTGEMSKRPDLVLIVLDTVRADRVSCYGYDRPTTPRIDALCARGVRFANASSTSAWTVPAHASLFTGLYPIHHRATQESPRLGPDPATLPEILAAVGYATFGVSANPLVGPVTGLDRGFERFVTTWAPAASPDGVHPNVTAVRELLAERAERPVFLFVNFMEAHSPNRPPEPERSRFLSLEPRERAARMESALALTPGRYYVDPQAAAADLPVLSDLYDGEIATLDRAVGELLDTLAAEGLGDALVVVTADHGESFGEHGRFRHAFELYSTTVRVPLILAGPGLEGAGWVREEPVSLVDVFATLLAQAGAASPGGEYPGRDLLAASGLEERPVFAEYYYPLQALSNLPPELVSAHPEVFAPFARRLRSVERGGLRLIASTPGGVELFDARGDPGELRDLAGDRAADAEQLGALLDAFVERAGGRPPLPSQPGAGERPSPLGDLDPDTAEQLRELGYLR